MKEYFEATANANLPSLGCTLAAGSRLELSEGNLSAAGRCVPVGADFRILVRHGVIVPISAEEAAKPERVAVAKTRPLHERAVLPVRAEESHTMEMRRRNADKDIIAYDNGEDRSPENERRVRGLRVEERVEKALHEEAEPPAEGKPAGEAARLAPKKAVDASLRAARIEQVEAANAALAERKAAAKKVAKAEPAERKTAPAEAHEAKTAAKAKAEMTAVAQPPAVEAKPLAEAKATEAKAESKPAAGKPAKAAKPKAKPAKAAKTEKAEGK